MEIPHSVKRFFSENGSNILTTLGCVGVVGVAIVSGKNSLEADKVLRAKKYETDRELTPKEKTKLVVPIYIPTILISSATIMCLVASNRISAGRTAAYAGALALAQEAARTYREKVEETVGPKKAKEIDDKVADEQIKKIDGKNPTVFGTGPYICYDSLTDRKFASDMNKIEAAQNRKNKKILSEGWCSLNEFYDEIGLAPAQIGEELGWDYDTMIDITFSSRLDEDGNPNIVMNFRNPPFPDTLRKY